MDESYGIEVSKLAGIPRWVIDRAYEVLSSLEEGQAVSEARVKTRAKPREESEQLYFIDEKAETIKKRLRQADPNTLTPIEALNLIYELKKLLQGEPAAKRARAGRSEAEGDPRDSGAEGVPSLGKSET